MSGSSRSLLKIDAKNLEHNFRYLQSKTHSNCNVAVSLKFDAYGLGAVGIAKILVNAGAEDFYVFDYQEALNIEGIDGVKNIYLFDGISEQNNEAVQRKGFIPVLSTQEQIDLWSKFPNSPYCIMIDTGMNRTGIGFEEGVEFLKSEKLHRPMYVLSHMACADDKASQHNSNQLKQIQSINKQFPDLKISFSNSAGIFLGDQYHFNQVRPGIALYGGMKNIFDDQIKNVIYLSAHAQTKRVIGENNNFVGYNATYEASAGKKIATFKIGYADGFSRSLSNIGKVYCNGKLLPVVGLVSMDYMTVDISALRDDEIDNLKYVEIIGDNITIDEMADMRGVSSYEIISGFASGRFERLYE